MPEILPDASQKGQISPTGRRIRYTTSATPSGKRNDIQGLRGIAIVSVLAFHLLPKRFTNGYLGVDIFFVLSGYLMTSILSRAPSVDKPTVLDFYARRFRRIVPLFALIIALVTLVVPLIFSATDISHYTEDVFWALPFATNMQNVLKHVDYWTQACRSLALHIILPPTPSFGLLPARAWQFLIGSIFFEFSVAYRKPECLVEVNEVADVPLNALCSCLAVVFLALCPLPLPTALTRIGTTILTGVILFNGSHFPSPFLINNGIIAYLGDISYVVYLIHWPVIVLTKYTIDSSDLDTNRILYCLCGTLLASIFVHHTFEQLFIRSKTSFAVAAVTLLYSIVLTVLLTGSAEHLSVVSHRVRMLTGGSGNAPNASNMFSNRTLLDETIKWNAVQATAMYFNNPPGVFEDTEPVKWTNYTEEGRLRLITYGNGTAKVLVIGNSYAYRAYPMIQRAFGDRFKEIRLLAHSGCLLLSAKTCYLSGAIDAVINRTKPDITFYIAKDLNFCAKLNGEAKDDHHTKNTKKVLEYWSNNTGTLVVEMQYIRPNVSGGVAYAMSKRLQTEASPKFDDLQLSLQGYEQQCGNDQKRMGSIKIPNMIVVKPVDHMCKETAGTCYYYNRTNLHSYYGDWDAHLASEGLNLLFPAYKKIIDEFLIKHDSTEKKKS